MCSLVHVCEDEKILGSINQLELNPVINEKIEMFKGMREMTATIKKAQQKLTREKRDLASTHIGQLMQRFQDRHFKISRIL
jgi:uncharacterized protein YukE